MILVLKPLCTKNLHTRNGDNVVLVNNTKFPGVFKSFSSFVVLNKIDISLSITRFLCRKYSQKIEHTNVAVYLMVDNSILILQRIGIAHR